MYRNGYWCMLAPNVNTERLAPVAIVWTIVLIGLLVVREIMRADARWAGLSALRLLNVLVLAMVISISGAGVIYAVWSVASTGETSVAGRSPQSGIDPPGSSTVPSAAPPFPSPSVGRSATPPSPSPSVGRSATPPAGGSSHGIEPTASANTASAMPSAPAPSATTAAVPMPSPTATAVWLVVAGPTIRTYEVLGSRVTGFQDVHLSERIIATASSPVTYVFPSFSDPEAAIRLTKILSGQFAGSYLCPDDEGVTFHPP
jgi:hypothetical protein